MLKDKVALVFGGTGDIGSAIAGTLEKNGAKVCRHGRSGEYAADVSNSDETKRLIEKVLSRFGRIDISINSVSAPAVIGSFEKKSWADFSKQLNVQLKAAVDSAGFIIPQMKKQGFGRIVNIISEYAADDPPASLSDYITAKYALLGFTKALAKEVGRFGITANAVSPSLIRNDFSKEVPEKLIEILIAKSPTGRLTNENDVAEAVLRVVSDEAGEHNGENIIISGGRII